MITQKVPHMIYGGDYNPEQWPEEVWFAAALACQAPPRKLACHAERRRPPSWRPAAVLSEQRCLQGEGFRTRQAYSGPLQGPPCARHVACEQRVRMPRRSMLL